MPSSSTLSSQLLAQPLDLLAKVALELQRRPAGFGLRPVHLPVVDDRAPAEHRLLDLLREHRSDGAEVVADRVDLLGDAPEEVEVAVERAWLRASRSPRSTKWWISTTGDGWPWRSMRPLRCSSRWARRDLQVDHAGGTGAGGRCPRWRRRSPAGCGPASDRAAPGTRP